MSDSELAVINNEKKNVRYIIHTKLVELDVSENALGPRGIEACKPLLASKETLARISFCNDGLSAEACESIRDLLLFRGENMPTSLTHLRFHNNMSGSGGAIAIADVVKNSPSLQLFELSSTRCGRDGGETLCSAFEFCPNIESINVGDNTFGIESGKILAQVLKNKTKLKYLKVSDIGLEDEGMSALLLSLGTEKCTNLIELDISCNDLTYEGLLSLGLVFRNNLQLEKLILDDNEIGSRGSMRVARAIEKNSKKLNHLAMMILVKQEDEVYWKLGSCFSDKEVGQLGRMYGMKKHLKLTLLKLIPESLIIKSGKFLLS